MAAPSAATAWSTRGPRPTKAAANKQINKQTNKQTNKQPQLPSVTHSGPRRGSMPRLPLPQATSSCVFCACACGSRRASTARLCVWACACARVCVRVAVEGEDLIHQLIRRNLCFGQLQHVQLDHGVGDRLARERAKLARHNRPSTTQRRPLQRFKPIPARAGGRAGADGCSTGVRTVPHGMAVCNGGAARRMAVPV